MSIYSIFGSVTKKKTRTGSLKCPSCKGDQLGIRERTGLEFLISRITNTRKYKCFYCHAEFRAADRRKAPRVKETAAVRHPA